MAEDWRIEWNEAEFGLIAHAEYVRAEEQRIGNLIAGAGRAAAPRSVVHRGPAPGHGADSIHAETVLEDIGWTVHVGWDQLHQYMKFTDLGSSHIPAQHYLEHAADRYAR